MPDSFKMKWDINWLYFLVVAVAVTQGVRNYQLQSDIDRLETIVIHLNKKAEFQMGVATAQNYVNVILVNEVFDKNISVPDANLTQLFGDHNRSK